jgi:RNA polymerase sigma factor (sigma-70 family)
VLARISLRSTLDLGSDESGWPLRASADNTGMKPPMYSRDEQRSPAPLISAERHTVKPPLADVFERYHQDVYRLCLGMLDNCEEAEDATQEVFLRAHRAWETYDPARSAPRTWLGHITVNYCRSALRRRRISGLAWRVLGRRVATTDATLNGRELRADLAAALRYLDTDHRTVILLRYYWDLSCAQIAESLQIRESTVHSRLYVARQRMQSALCREA